MLLIKSEYANKIIPLLNEAKTNIDILMYQWNYLSHVSETPIQKFNLALKSACLRGVPVRALMHSGSPGDHLCKINAKTGQYLTNWGASVKYYKKGGVLHSKAIIIDRKYLIIGSHNYSQRSMKSNIEISVLVDNGDDILRFQNYFNILWGQS